MGPVGRVYPRVGGATCPTVSGITWTLCSGLSPRGRGNPCSPSALASKREQARVYPRVGGATQSFANRFRRHDPRSIPAWAGQPTVRADGRYRTTGRSIPAWAGQPLLAATPIAVIDTLTGLSPRGRGNLVRRASQYQSVPARVYPRVGGATPTGGKTKKVTTARVYPRVGGATR